MTRSDFARIANLRREKYHGADIPPQMLDRRELGRQLPCPECFAKMECFPYCGPGNVVMDACNRCDWVWLDAGEITKIEQAPGQRETLAPVPHSDWNPVDELISAKSGGQSRDENIGGGLLTWLADAVFSSR